MFKFSGPILHSKSWLNRAQIINFYQGNPTLIDKSSSQDVIDLQTCLEDFRSGKNEFELGQGGTTFRFFVFLVSRKLGQYLLTLHPRLLSRPQEDLFGIFKQLGVQLQRKSNGFELYSKGWKLNSNFEVNISGQTSSQFASGLLLNSWQLEEKLKINISKPILSEDYLQMTLQLLKKFGLKFTLENSETFLSIQVAPHQLPVINRLQPELDVSSAFALSACAIVDGDVEIKNWPSDSIQPDQVFLTLFEKMGIKYKLSKDIFKIKKQNCWQAIDADLNNSPDLFPVLAALCALAKGRSYLHGAVQLKDKESNRIEKTAELLSLCGYNVEKNNGGLIIFGQTSTKDKSKEIFFNPDHDHRMAMAAAVLMMAGFNIKLSDSLVVKKSYPEFWLHIGILK